MIPSEYCYRVLAIDPGTDTLGSAVLDVDVRVGDVEVPYAGTWHAARRFDPDSDAAYTYGSRLARIREHQDSLVRLLQICAYTDQSTTVAVQYMSSLMS